MLLSTQQFNAVSNAIKPLNPTQLAWVSGYLSGLLGQEQVNTPALNPTTISTQISTTVLYGSQTGNSKKIATQLHNTLQTQHHAVTLCNIKDYRPQNLKKEQRIIIVISTHGNGEPPDEARAFFTFLQSERAPKLSNLNYAILALGDSSYDEFCQSGIYLDQRFAELGATRFMERVECDVDFAPTAKHWQQRVLDALPQDHTNVQFQSSAIQTAIQDATTYTVENPFHAELLAQVTLTDTGSTKDVIHLEFSLEDSGIAYQAGDILAITLPNDNQLVSAFLAQIGLNPDDKVVINQQTLDLKTALTESRELSVVTRRQLKQYAQLIRHPELQQASEDKEALHDWLYAADWLDIAQEFHGSLSAQAWVDLLRPLQPRQYSIASSPLAHTDEVHLLVKRVAYTFNGREHLGVASNGLAALTAGQRIPVYVKENPHFKLPADPNAKIIMIGAGTGVAPFRSFLFEREALGIKGNSWLFFGEQQFRTDFLYQTDWQQLLTNGTLAHMNVAFSRDQAQKIYVQHRVLEHGAALYDWIQAGAYIYVCGDMNGMAKDVHAALIDIITQYGQHSPAEATQLMEELISAQRYQRDVY